MHPSKLIALGLAIVSINSIAITNQLSHEIKFRLAKLESELKGKHLKIATIQNGALGHVVEENGIMVGRGVAFDIIDLLQARLHFTYSIVLPEENVLGSQTSGIFGLLYNNKVDLAAAFLPMTSTYWQYAEFATTLDFGEWVVVLKRSRARGEGVAAPFAPSVWIFTTASLLCIVPVLNLLVRLHPSSENVSLGGCLWVIFGALTKQGTRIGFRTDSSRLMLVTWWIFVVILAAFYTANLTAFLTLSKVKLPLKAPEDITRKDYSWIATTRNVIEEEVNSYNYSGLQKVFKSTRRRFLKNVNTSTLTEWVAKKNYLYIGESSNVHILLYDAHMQSKRCDYVATKWHVFKCSRTFAYSRSFKFGPLFNLILRSLVESGHVKYLKEKTATRRVCPTNDHSEGRELTNSDLIQAYYILAAGLAVASLTLLAEILINYSKKREISEEIRSSAWQSKAVDYGQFNIRMEEYRSCKRFINGREYWVVDFMETKCTIMPVRGGSALLFYYAE